MTDKPFHPLEGGCDCGRVRYRLESPPMFVHCCHCRWCQRETGTSFALNALIEADRVTLLREPPELIDTPSESGDGQMIARCPLCRIAVWMPLSKRRPLHQLHPRRQLGRSRPTAARHSHLHGLKAALGGTAAGRRGGAGILRAREILAAGKPETARGADAEDQRLSRRQG